jgi:hypothetical protein
VTLGDEDHYPRWAVALTIVIALMVLSCDWIVRQVERVVK